MEELTGWTLRDSGLGRSVQPVSSADGTLASALACWGRRPACRQQCQRRPATEAARAARPAVRRAVAGLRLPGGRAAALLRLHRPALLLQRLRAQSARRWRRWRRRRAAPGQHRAACRRGQWGVPGADRGRRGAAAARAAALVPAAALPQPPGARRGARLLPRQRQHLASLPAAAGHRRVYGLGIQGLRAAEERLPRGVCVQRLSAGGEDPRERPAGARALLQGGAAAARARARHTRGVQPPERRPRGLRLARQIPPQQGQVLGVVRALHVGGVAARQPGLAVQLLRRPAGGALRAAGFGGRRRAAAAAAAAAALPARRRGRVRAPAGLHRGAPRGHLPQAAPARRAGARTRLRPLL